MEKRISKKLEAKKQWKELSRTGKITKIEPNENNFQQ